MTNTTLTDVEREPRIAPRSEPSHAGGRGWRLWWARVQFLLSLALTGGMLTYLLWTPQHANSPTTADQRSAAREVVRLTGPQRIHVDPECPLCRRLRVTTVEQTQIASPVLMVTGTVAASLRPANGQKSDYWQFNSPELLSTFTDWQKATADIAFNETQLAQVKQLADSRTGAQEKLVQRLKKLVEAGTDTDKDLAAAQAELIQSQIQGRKEVYEAETALRLAQRTEALQVRQLQQAGLNPDLLRSTTWDLDIVMADVPEGFVARVKLGQGCEARFFGFPEQLFTGKVLAIAPVLSKERRSLRVLFAIDDPKDQLRPGMFAEIGLGTDARQTLLIPAEAIVHVGRSDYVLVHTGGGDWRVTEVQVGELHESAVEILSGLRVGDRVAGDGVILLKPVMIQALQAQGSPQALQAAHSSGGGRS
jgi:membrane fusion protein, heavy metal efflux system